MKLSIIIPVYNVEKYLKKCLESILTQNLKLEDYEVLIINDGSPDSSQAIIDEYISHPNFLCFKKENGGLSSARNLGIEKARGEYIFFLDSDDYLEPKSLNRLLLDLYNNKVDCLAFEYQHVNDDGVKIPHKYYYRNNDVLSSEKFLNEYILVPNVWRYLFRRELILKNNLRFTKGVWHEDEEFTPIFISYVNSIRYTDVLVYNYLQREGSIISTRDSSSNKKKIRDLITIIQNIDVRRTQTSGDLNKGLKKRINLLLLSIVLKMSNDKLDDDFVFAILENLKSLGYYPLDVSHLSLKQRVVGRLLNVPIVLKAIR